jgi:hypothetical protein
VATISGCTDATARSEFDAFFSYSRKDVQFAEALETALEKFRIPPGLPGGGRRLRIFRDEHDLTGAILDEALEEYIASSRKLLVLTSPAVRTSTYVDAEIKRFASTRGAHGINPGTGQSARRGTAE